MSETKICPTLSGHDRKGKLIKEPCIKHECQHWRHVTGRDPQDPEQKIDYYDCSIDWQLGAKLENNRMVHELGASMDKMNNNLVEVGERIALNNGALATVLQHARHDMLIATDREEPQS